MAILCYKIQKIFIDSFHHNRIFHFSVDVNKFMCRHGMGIPARKSTVRHCIKKKIFASEIKRS